MPFPTTIWWLILFWLLPIVTALGLTFSVLVSANARSYQEAQQKSALLVIPLVLLATGVIMGAVSMTFTSYFALGLALLIADVVMLFMVSSMFRPEKMI